MISHLNLGECCKIISGSTPDTSNPEYWGGDIVWITPKDLSETADNIITNSSKKITKKGYDSCSTQILPKGTVLLSSRAPIGLVAIAGKELCTNQGFKSLIPDTSLVLSKYLMYWLRYKKELLNSLGNGATFKEISKKTVENIKVSLPSIEEQKRIASILDKANELKEKRKKAIEKLDELVQSVFIDMFGDPILNPKGWKKRTLSDICIKIQDGTHFSPPIVENGVPYITAKHINENSIDFFSNPWFISQEEHNNIYKRCDVKKNDVIYIKDGATTGKAAINNYEFEFSMLSSLAFLRVNPNIANPHYLCHWLNNPSVKKVMVSEMSGGAIKRLTLNKINNLPILMPPLYLQKQFDTLICKINDQKAKFVNSLDKMENIFNSLSQEFF